MEGLLQREGELIGRLHYKEGHDLYHWRLGWFVLEGSTLHFSSGDEDGEEEVLQLKQLQELSTHACIVCPFISSFGFGTISLTLYLAGRWLPLAKLTMLVQEKKGIVG